MPGRFQNRPFAEVKAQVMEIWRDQRQRENFETYLTSLLKKYDVVVDEDLKPLIGPLTASSAGQASFWQEGLR